MKYLAIVTVAFATLTACSDNRPCLKGHDVVIMMPVFNGKTTTLVPTTQFVCDEYGPKHG